MKFTGQPEGLMAWDAQYEEAVQRLNEVPDMPLITHVEGAYLSLEEIQEASAALTEIDALYTDVKNRFDLLYDTAKEWEERHTVRLRAVAADSDLFLSWCRQNHVRPIKLSAEGDRKGWAADRCTPYRERKVIAKTMSETVAAKKRQLRRFDERLEQHGHNTRAIIRSRNLQ